MIAITVKGSKFHISFIRHGIDSRVLMGCEWRPNLELSTLVDRWELDDQSPKHPLSALRVTMASKEASRLVQEELVWLDLDFSRYSHVHGNLLLYLLEWSSALGESRNLVLVREKLPRGSNIQIDYVIRLGSHLCVGIFMKAAENERKLIRVVMHTSRSVKCVEPNGNKSRGMTQETGITLSPRQMVTHRQGLPLL
jgi:hypothetical protein